MFRKICYLIGLASGLLQESCLGLIIHMFFNNDERFLGDGLTPMVYVTGPNYT